MSRVLVTGGRGFIGRHTLPLLAARGFEVHATSRTRPASPPGDATWHEVDLLDPRATARVVSDVGATHLLHLAWCTTPGEYWTSTENVRWVEASLELLRAFAQAGGRRAVLAGSCAEYDLRDGFCSEAATPMRPDTLYGTSKHAVDADWAAAAPALDLTVATGRVFHLYGPGEHPSRLVASVIRALLQGEPAACTSGEQVRDFLHSADVAAAFVHLVAGDVDGALNIASGSPVSVRAVAERLGALLDRSDLLGFGARPTPAGEPPRIVADVARITESGWVPSFTLDAGLADTVEWWRRELSGRTRSTGRMPDSVPGRRPHGDR